MAKPHTYQGNGITGPLTAGPRGDILRCATHCDPRLYITSPGDQRPFKTCRKCGGPLTVYKTGAQRDQEQEALRANPV